MRLRELEIFNALMKTGTTVGAAEAMAISQPAVSKSIKHLESRMGVRLFSRVGGRLRPTPEAQTLYGHVRNVFARLETVDRISQDLRGGKNAVISAAATPSLGSTLLARAVARLHERNPGVKVIFRSITSHDVGRRVAEGEADFGMVHSRVDRAGLVTEDLLNLKAVCILARGHPLAALPVVALSDLLPYPLISYRPGTVIGNAVAAAFRAEGLTKDVALQTSLSASACVLAARGAGVAVTDPLALLCGDRPDLVARPLAADIEIKVQLLFSHEHPCSRAAERLLEQVREVATEIKAEIRRHMPARVGDRRSLAPGLGDPVSGAITDAERK